MKPPGRLYKGTNIHGDDFLRTNTDNEPPVVTCPNNVPSVYVAIGVADAVITWSPLPTSNDVVEGVITTIVCEDSPGNVMMSGDRFLVGTTTMTCKSSDSVPNEGTCQFDVTVLVCSKNCLNGGTLDLTNCICSCTQDYSGDTCSVCSLSCLNDGIVDLESCTCNCARSWTTTNCSVCPLNSGSCFNGGTFDESKCECVCPRDLSGVRCEVGDPCLATPAPCNGVGEYCFTDTYGAALGYTCECRLLDKYHKSGASCVFALRQITVILRVLGVNGTAVEFFPIFVNPSAASTAEFLEIVGKVITRHIERDPTTREVVVVLGVYLFDGSIMTTLVLSLPNDSALTPEMVMTVLNNDIVTEGVLNDGSTYLNVDPEVKAIESTTECPADYCQNGGVCSASGRYPRIIFTCSCPTGFTGLYCGTPIIVVTTVEPPVVVGGLSTIAIVLIVVGILAILLAILGCCMCCCILGRRRYEEGEKYANWRQRASNDSPMFNNRSDMEMEDRRIGRLAQVLARSPYMQQSAQTGGFVRPYIASGLEAVYYDHEWVNEEDPVPTRVARNPFHS